VTVGVCGQNGSHGQRQKYLPETCTGDKVGGMCMSEPGAWWDGTLPLSLTSHAKLTSPLWGGLTGWLLTDEK
jgi:alkylation response protein AidB-like acyl-CoA dehydrogenase